MLNSNAEFLLLQNWGSSQIIVWKKQHQLCCNGY